MRGLIWSEHTGWQIMEKVRSLMVLFKMLIDGQIKTGATTQARAPAVSFNEFINEGRSGVMSIISGVLCQWFSKRSLRNALLVLIESTNQDRFFQSWFSSRSERCRLGEGSLFRMDVIGIN